MHPFFFIVAFFAAITGYIKYFFIFTIFILIHECGHIVSACFYKWKIEKITIFPLGAVTFFDEKVNKPIKEEFVIAISGVLWQTLFFKLLEHISDMAMYKSAHLFLLCFNLLPIYPLDGGKIINLILNLLLPFLKSYTITLGISYGIILSLFHFCYSNLVFVLALFLLLYQVFKETRKGKWLFHKFLLERYLYTFPFKKEKYIKGYHLEKMKRDYTHIFWIQKNSRKEKEILKCLFDKKK